MITSETTNHILILVFGCPYYMLLKEFLIFTTTDPIYSLISMKIKSKPYSRWRKVASFTPLPLYLHGKTARVLTGLGRLLGNRAGGEEKYLCPHQELSGCPAHSPVTVLTQLCQQ
jgi:hypothetical protein